jgi:hypothetical protein
MPSAIRGESGRIHHLPVHQERGFAAAYREAVRAALDRGYSRLLVVGDDIPGLTPRHLTRALAALEESDVVLGPAHDGGYYLLGIREWQPALFDRIPWGTGEVLHFTRRRASGQGLRLMLLESRPDLDDEAGLAAWLSKLLASTASVLREASWILALFAPRRLLRPVLWPDSDPERARGIDRRFTRHWNRPPPPFPA